MSVFNKIATALYSTLSSGTALTTLLSGTTAVYNTKAPDTATLPYVVFSHQAGQPLNINPSDIRDEVYWIRAITQSSLGYAGSIDAQICNLLHGKTLSVSGYTNFNTVREQEVQLVDTQPDGADNFIAGAMYRIQIDS
jgi:hypothetical protein